MTDHPTWRKSTFSGSNGDCLELLDLDDSVLVRNSNRPTDGTLTLERAAVAAFVAASATGELDDLA